MPKWAPRVQKNRFGIHVGLILSCFGSHLSSILGTKWSNVAACEATVLEQTFVCFFEKQTTLEGPEVNSGCYLAYLSRVTLHPSNFATLAPAHLWVSAGSSHEVAGPKHCKHCFQTGLSLPPNAANGTKVNLVRNSEALHELQHTKANVDLLWYSHHHELPSHCGIMSPAKFSIAVILPSNRIIQVAAPNVKLRKPRKCNYSKRRSSRQQQQKTTRIAFTIEPFAVSLKARSETIEVSL